MVLDMLKNSYCHLLSPAKYPLTPGDYPEQEPSPHTSIPRVNHSAHNQLP